MGNLRQPDPGAIQHCTLAKCGNLPSPAWHLFALPVRRDTSPHLSLLFYPPFSDVISSIRTQALPDFPTFFFLSLHPHSNFNFTTTSSNNQTNLSQWILSSRVPTSSVRRSRRPPLVLPRRPTRRSPRTATPPSALGMHPLPTSLNKLRI